MKVKVGRNDEQTNCGAGGVEAAKGGVGAMDMWWGMGLQGERKQKTGNSFYTK